ncbi:CAP domain-containing protein [Desulfitobacterium sp.]|uniref:CAP domain-containing protein n=1 Tax=Desulfitobacterium sp. TaxID=49981 RepID=UPI002B2218D5|nr:CAP domain-containing protein [Desulfitobacterium sp.]MEA4900692.1 CAP domain-containing protein [Desulfitobacterium sp.]
MKKFSKVAISLTFIFSMGIAVPAQAAIYAANNYSSSSGYSIPLRSYVYTSPTQAAASTPTNTTTNTGANTTITPPVASQATPSAGSSVISLKPYFLSYPTTNTTPSTPAPAPAPSPTPGTPVPAPAPAPTPAPTTPTSSKTIPAATSISTQEQQMIDEINKERANVGLAPLKVDLRLVGVAQVKANDMKTNGYFSHTSPTYGSPYDMMKMAGIQYYSAGENIARNISVDAAMAAFMSSSGHKANILNANYTHVGVGIVYSSSGTYFVQEFARE